MKRKKAKAAGDRRALAWLILLASACNPEAPEVVDEPAPPEPHAEARERLAAYEQAQRESVDFAAIPASDGRFGADPHRVIALPDGRLAGLLRGADRLVLFDRDGVPISEAPTVHDPTDLAWRDGELLVVGSGEARIDRFAVSDALELRGSVALLQAFAPRVIATEVLSSRPGNRADNDAVFVGDESGQLHVLRGDALTPAFTVASDCRGPLALALADERLFANCLIDHRVRVDRLDGDALTELGAITHDGPIWSFALGPELDGERLLALTGVEDRPLDRSDGGFGYIDSFVFVYGIDPAAAITRRAVINVSELGVVTPKWSRWRSDEEMPTLELAGFASTDLLRLRFAGLVSRPGNRAEGLGAAPTVERAAALPGTVSAVALADGSLLAANSLLDGWLHLGPDGQVNLRSVADPRDDRSFEERLGEALVFTTAMAPWNHADGQRSRFTCETCHFEGRGDGRTHFTGREREGQPIHATSKPLLGLFPNRPYFTRALDRSMAIMVDNEFRVANRHNGRDPWFALSDADLPWLKMIAGWPGEVDGEQLRRALMAFLQRYSMPQNPATRGRDRFTALEREGARVYAELCEGCHRARLVSDDPGTRVDPGADFEAWERLIFADNGPIVWASADYAATEIVPYVHADGARVTSLRRLYIKAPHFTNGSARDLAELLAGVRKTAAGVTHGAGTIPQNEQLEQGEREALAAFLRLL